VESPYEVLGVPPDVDEETLNEAYRERVKEAHPDQGGSVEAFMRVQAAYEAALDGYGPDERSGEAGTGPGSGPRAGAGAGAGADTGTGRDDRRTGRPRPGTHVEYLNYEALDDHGWGLEDGDLFGKAADAGLDEEDYGEFRVRPRESLLEAAERRGFAWPFACRGGACVNCAVYVAEGSMATRVDTVLPEDLERQGFQLSCNGIPTTPELKVVYNVKHLPALEELLLPPRPFEQAHADD
jgi:curved DNA-binding protein CbpA